MPIINEYDALTGANLEIDITEEELAGKIGEVQTKSFAEILQENAAAKAALLERLGITAEEAALLLG
jgi:hypothetical protein